jgi:hypothetical protein
MVQWSLHAPPDPFRGFISKELTELREGRMASGTELGSTGADVNDQFITPGQSLSWTEETDLMNAGSEGAVGTTDTCTLVQWYQ